ncbi:hypothetical protein P731_09030 [Listeria monocytogenes SHL014]|jgi:hypothetical protein|nr:hypothetical protein M642_12180 [Listeria monocytogenes]EUJ20731.1 hypothetical protein G161_04470 [Listeria monocytogenes FSL F6-684]EZH69586.1 hypothetical protein T283_12345 [Listeria monocytogenes N53-1]KHK06148.1 hypothetical protein I612_10155 [Listeria monocytogenes SHL004]KHK11240.1 hypothetical protein I793_09890 [Listeria monocytogenes SHL001]KHK15095.1 hypothetical protein I613_07834 [Listeria monocytogenes SHL005]KHK17322.1 hypothetical protein I614_11390 [Listeria monocytogene
MRAIPDISFLADMCGIALFILLQIGGDLFEN